MEKQEISDWNTDTASFIDTKCMFIKQVSYICKYFNLRY